jgi:hypothetical protein
MRLYVDYSRQIVHQGVTLQRKCPRRSGIGRPTFELGGRS